MRRLRVEWLILPLLLLPLAVAGTLCLLARSAYRARVAPYRTDPRAAVEGILAGPAAETLRLVFSATAGLPDADAGLHPVPILLKGRELVAWTPAPLDGNAAWTCTGALSPGLLAPALADARVRLEVETGRPPAQLESAPADAKSFASLLSNPDLDALRVAPLPASAKAYVLRRWLRTEPGRAEWEHARALLEMIADVEARLAAARSPGALGVFAVGRGVVIVRGPDDPIWVAPRGTVTSAFVGSHALQVGGDVEIVWSAEAPPEPAGDVEEIWSGALGTPLAGTYTVRLPYGDAWWRGALFRRWVPLASTVVLLLLAAPVLLLVWVRRRARLDEARARFLNEIAHDLRTPLTSLRLYAEMLSGDDVAPPARERYAGVIARESARLSALLANLLDLSRLEGGKRLYDVQDVGVRGAVTAAVADFRALYPGRANDITCEGDDMAVRADPTGLARCLGNLLDNAGKFTETGTSIRVTWVRAEDDIRITVADDGPGVDAAEQRSVFERYARGDRAQANGVQGTGLGLSLVRELMQGMGGSVALVGGPGAAFELRFPAVEKASRNTPAIEATAAGGGERA